VSRALEVHPPSGLEEHRLAVEFTWRTSRYHGDAADDDAQHQRDAIHYA